MTSIGKFNEFMKRESNAESYDEITYFIVVARHLVPDYRPVYPYIVKAVCAQELGNHKEAEKSYELALQNEPDNPDALGGLGIVNLYNGNYDKAADLFERASQKSDPDQARNERVNKLIAILSGRLLNRYNFQDKEFVLNINTDRLAKEDEKVFTLKAQALIYYHDSQFGRAVKIYKELEERTQLDDTGSVIYFYLSEKLMDTRNPHEILVRGITNSAKLKNINPATLWEYLASYYAEVNQIDQAKAIFRDYLLPPHQNSRSLMASYSILQKKSGDEKACRDSCYQILSSDQFGIPQNFPDFYYCGLANFLLGNKPRAEYDFERSNGFGQWYETVV
jgi:tetratricopeptide (TPR) repeat protein